MSATPTRRDHTLARKKTQAEAERYPLLAHLGLARRWTAQDLADRRERLRAQAELDAASRKTSTAAEVAQLWSELEAEAGADDVQLVRRQHQWSADVGGFMARADHHHVANALRGHLAAVRAGRPLIDPWTRARHT